MIDELYLFKILLIFLVPACIFLSAWLGYVLRRLRKVERLLKVYSKYEQNFLKSLVNSTMDTVPLKDQN